MRRIRVARVCGPVACAGGLERRAGECVWVTRLRCEMNEGSLDRARDWPRGGTCVCPEAGGWTLWRQLRCCCGLSVSVLDPVCPLRGQRVLGLYNAQSCLSSGLSVCMGEAEMLQSKGARHGASICVVWGRHEF